MKLVESRVYGQLIIITDYILLGLLWVICSLPVVTILPASVASLYVIVQWKNGSSLGLLSNFFRGIRRLFFSNLLLNILTLLMMGIMSFMIKQGDQAFTTLCFASLVVYGLFLLSWISNCASVSNLTAKVLFKKSTADVIFHFGGNSVALIFVGVFSLFISIFPLALFIFAGGFWKIISLLIVKVGK